MWWSLVAGKATAVELLVPQSRNNRHAIGRQFKWLFTGLLAYSWQVKKTWQGENWQQVIKTDSRQTRIAAHDSQAEVAILLAALYKYSDWLLIRSSWVNRCFLQRRQSPGRWRATETEREEWRLHMKMSEAQDETVWETPWQVFGIHFEFGVPRRAGEFG